MSHNHQFLDATLDFVAGTQGAAGSSRTRSTAVDHDVLSWLMMQGDLFSNDDYSDGVDNSSLPLPFHDATFGSAPAVPDILSPLHGAMLDGQLRTHHQQQQGLLSTGAAAQRTHSAAPPPWAQQQPMPLVFGDLSEAPPGIGRARLHSLASSDAGDPVPLINRKRGRGLSDTVDSSLLHGSTALAPASDSLIFDPSASVKLRRKGSHDPSSKPPVPQPPPFSGTASTAPASAASAESAPPQSLSRAVAQMESQLEQLKAENTALKAQLRATSSALMRDTSAQEDERLAQVHRIQIMVAEKASDEELKRVILQYKDLHGDFGRDRWVALRHHLRCLKSLLLPNQVTKMCMWSVGQEDSVVVPSSAAAAVAGDGGGGGAADAEHFHPVADAAVAEPSSSSGVLKSTMRRHPAPAPHNAAASLAASDIGSGPSGSSPESLSVAHGAGTQPHAESSSVWEALCRACDLSPEQQQGILSLRDTVRAQRKKFAGLLGQLRDLEGSMTSNFQGLELQMNMLMAFLTPRQIAMFLDWMERTKPLFSMLNSLVSWPAGGGATPVSSGET